MLHIDDDTLNRAGPKVYTSRELIKAYLAAGLVANHERPAVRDYYRGLYLNLARCLHLRLPHPDAFTAFEEAPVVTPPAVRRMQRKALRRMPDAVDLADYNAIEVAESFLFLVSQNFELLRLRCLVQSKRMEELALLDEAYRATVGYCDAAIEAVGAGLEVHFTLLYGEHATVVKSADLFARGFNDAQPPAWQDFWEAYDTPAVTFPLVRVDLV